MFRRRSRQDADQPGSQAAQAPEPGASEAGNSAGPWDVSDDVPALERIDFGSLRVPVREGFEIQVSMAEDRAAWITIVRGESGLQLQAFAAPKSDGIWDSVRQEIAAEVAEAGGAAEEADGPFGRELRARIAPEDTAGRSQHGALAPVRVFGVDGPRWLLRGVINGPAAHREELARPLEELFSGVVVVRGTHPMAPREMLELRLPDEAQQALGGAVAEPESGRWPLGPMERGPEITETR